MYISKEVSAATRLVPSFGKSFQMNMVLIQQDHIMVSLISNWKELTFTLTKLLEADMSPELCSWIWNQELWIRLELGPLDSFLDQIILYLDRLEQETTGLKVIIHKELNSSILSSMSLEKKPKAVTAFKAFKLPTL